MDRTQIYLPKNQIDSLRQIAQERKVSVSEIIRSLVEDKIKKHPSKNRKEELLKFAQRINKIGVKGPKDLATNLDKYLYDESEQELTP